MNDNFDPEELVQVLSADPVQVRMAADLLTAAGIECFVFDEESSRMLGTTPAVPARLMVRAQTQSDALVRLKELGFED
jgi:hypothetical protein